ncbi:DJ-1/PfpI family protein [Curtobacterium aurantiacum]|uniref:DJ-1/PfpI family protein n=1 Tax=Curtobacterium aurantiacum TaxID=3236919 RepID=UPI0027DC27D6|nr:DJ-1/PfpI family protein [Curtobacterium flaccumfaciens]
MRIAIYAFDGITMFHLSVPQMVFDEVTRLGLADWETFVFSDRSGTVRTAEGLTVGPVHGLEAADDADLVVVPSWTDDGTRLPAPTEQAVVDAHARGSTVVGLCLGSIAVAGAGLLAGRSAVTHW